MDYMTKAEIEAVHPIYKEWLPEWQFYIHSYYGGKHYRDGSYLVQHPFESVGNYERRKKIAYFYNYCQPIVDIFVSHLNRPKHERDYGSLKGDALFSRFLRDADFEGTSYTEYIKVVERYASIYGRVTVVVDKPNIKASTVLEAEENDIRPYCTTFTPENVLDWRYVRLDSGRYVLDMIKLREYTDAEVTIYRIWTRTGWELWEGSKKDKDAVLIDSGAHELGEVPVVNVYNKRGSDRMLGQSDLQDIADINKNIYYLCSDAKEVIENTAFPMLAEAHQSSSGETQEVGPKNIVGFDGDVANGKPFWLEPPHSSLAEIREWVSQDKMEIFRIANLGGMINVETSKQPWSGPGQEMQSNRLTAAMSQKADLAEDGEVAILTLVAKWEGREFDGSVDYKRDFAVRDITASLTNAINAQGARVDSALFVKENQKKIVTSSLPTLKDELRAKIFEEIDNAEVTIIPVEDGGDNNSNKEE